MPSITGTPKCLFQVVPVAGHAGAPQHQHFGATIRQQSPGPGGELFSDCLGIPGIGRPQYWHLGGINAPAPAALAGS